MPTVHCRLSYWGNFSTQPLLNISDPNWQSTLVQYQGSGSGDGYYDFQVQAFGGDDRRTVQIIVGAGTALLGSLLK